MTTHQKTASTVIALIMVSIIFYLVRKRRLREEYALFWIGCGILMLGVIWFYQGLLFVSSLIGSVTPTTTLFLFGFIFVLLLCLKISVSLSQLKTQIKILAQEVALLTTYKDEHHPPEPGDSEKPCNKLTP
ncbi:MAG: hypothetical protein BZ151_11705 [Desulfobacca sp. 4484_104]|nr:MAG: hypothetical protein BZ151_11705 [Desulfobacca sp. 4484_104]